MIQHHEIAIHEIKPVQLITRLFGIGDLVIHDERGALGGGRVALADLAYGSEFAEEREERWGVEGVGEVFYEEDSRG